MSTKNAHTFMVFGRVWLDTLLLDAVTGTTSGEWFNISGFHPFTIHIKGIANATVAIYASNSTTQPLDSANEILIGSTISADALIMVDSPIHWVKVGVTAYVSGSITAYLVGMQ